MTQDEYCTKVCRGKCCKAWLPDGDIWVEVWKCKHQDDSGACTKFNQWKDTGSCGETLVTIGRNTTTIETAIAEELLPKWIIEQCCYAHPELLEDK